MTWWSEHVVPVITGKACNTKEITPYRQRLCAALGGDVLEIGFGSGHNMMYLPPKVDGLWAVEPSKRVGRYAERRIAAASIPVTRAGLDGQSLDLPDDRFDHALSTFTLCTIPDPVAALREVRRVLKPGGEFHFVEHGQSADPKVARFQQRWDPVQRRLFAGCHVSRAIADLVEEAGRTFLEYPAVILKHAPSRRLKVLTGHPPGPIASVFTRECFRTSCSAPGNGRLRIGISRGTPVPDPPETGSPGKCRDQLGADCWMRTAGCGLLGADCPTPVGRGSRGAPSAGPRQEVGPAWARRRWAGGSWRPSA